MGGSRPEVDLAPILTKRLHIAGTVLRSRPLEEKIALVQEFSRRVLPLLASGRITPVVDRSVEWQRIGDAHRAMERNENFGKIVLDVNGATGA